MVVNGVGRIPVGMPLAEPPVDLDEAIPQIDPSAGICRLEDVVVTFELTRARNLSDAIIEEAEPSDASLTASRWTSMSESRPR